MPPMSPDSGRRPGRAAIWRHGNAPVHSWNAKCRNGVQRWRRIASRTGMHSTPFPVSMSSATGWRPTGRRIRSPASCTATSTSTTRCCAVTPQTWRRSSTGRCARSVTRCWIWAGCWCAGRLRPTRWDQPAIWPSWADWRSAANSLRPTWPRVGGAPSTWTGIRRWPASSSVWSLRAPGPVIWRERQPGKPGSDCMTGP